MNDNDDDDIPMVTTLSLEDFARLKEDEGREGEVIPGLLKLLQNAKCWEKEKE